MFVLSPECLLAVRGSVENRTETGPCSYIAGERVCMDEISWSTVGTK